MTAEYLCETTYPARAGDVALVHAGAGGVGLLLIQLLKQKGITVYTTVSTPEKTALVREAGADEAILYTEVDFVETVRSFTKGNAPSPPKGFSLSYLAKPCSSCRERRQLQQPGHKSVKLGCTEIVEAAHRTYLSFSRSSKGSSGPGI
jgi:threonine dehydrogenase-like Zn-dependent dehydrogenase